MEKAGVKPINSLETITDKRKGSRALQKQDLRLLRIRGPNKKVLADYNSE